MFMPGIPSPRRLHAGGYPFLLRRSPPLKSLSFTGTDIPQTEAWVQLRIFFRF